MLLLVVLEYIVLVCVCFYNRYLACVWLNLTKNPVLLIVCHLAPAIHYPPSTAAVFVSLRQAPWWVPVAVAGKEPRPSTTLMMTRRHSQQKRKRELQQQRLLRLRRLPPRSDCGHERVIVLLPRRPLRSLASITTCVSLLSFNQLNPHIRSLQVGDWEFRPR